MGDRRELVLSAVFGIILVIIADSVLKIEMQKIITKKPLINLIQIEYNEQGRK